MMMDASPGAMGNNGPPDPFRKGKNLLPGIGFNCFRIWKTWWKFVISRFHSEDEVDEVDSDEPVTDV